MSKPLDIVIPAAGMGRRMRSYGPKSLVQVGGETIIARQLRVLRGLYPKGRTVVVAGFEADRLKRAVPDYVKVVVNPLFDTTNVAYSILLGLHHTAPTRSALVVYGDLVFGPELVAGLGGGASCVLVDGGAGREQEVGLNVVGGYATHLSYGLSPKWAHVMVLAQAEKQAFIREATNPKRLRHFGYEVLNHVIDAGGRLLARPAPAGSYVEVDTSKDISRAEQIFAQAA
jgi:choline kinase